MPREELAGWLLGRRKERDIPQMRRVMAVPAGETAATRDFAVMGQDEERCQSRANQWLAPRARQARQAPHLKRARRLEAGRWRAATRGTIKRWFVELHPLCWTVRPEIEWTFDEVMLVASRARKGVVTGNEGLLPAGQEDAPCDASCLLQLQG
jgi:hypothetical protein